MRHTVRRALGGVEERRDLLQVLLAEPRVRLHHRVAELRRVADVGLEVRRPAAGRADLGEVRRAEVGAAGAEVGVALQAPGHREELGPFDRLLVVREALPLRPLGTATIVSEPSASRAVAPL